MYFARFHKRLTLSLLAALPLLMVNSLYAQTFSTGASMSTSRYEHTATPLPDGTVLIAGGFTSVNEGAVGAVTATALIYDPKTKTYTATTGSMKAARAGHTATLLPDGKVLVAGGQGYIGGFLSTLSSAELYDPGQKTFSVTGSMTTPRSFGPAVLLQDGTVLMTGGTLGTPSASAELYQPSTGAFVATGNMNAARDVHTATLLGDGLVLIAGGQGSSAPLSSAEVYFPSSGQFSVVGNMTHARSYHTSTLLYDGTVLVAGGFGGSSSLSTAEVYDPSTLAFTAVGSLKTARDSQTATALRDGTVLIAGGESWSSGTFLNLAEVYSPSNKIFATTGNLSTARDLQTATLLNDGTILVAGGDYAPTSEIYSYSFTSGTLNPKYIVLDVIYAPPGSKSSVSYGHSSTVGTSTSLSDAFTKGTSISASINLQYGIFGGGGTNTYTASSSYTQESDTSSSIAVQQTTTNSVPWPGPVSSAIGVDHDYDIVQVWLNPAVNLTIAAAPGQLLWQGYSYDPSDIYSPNDMDVINIPIACLKNYFSSLNGCNAPKLVQRIQRSWDASGAGGLTAADYAQILLSDPFATNPNFNPATPNSDGTLRFDEQAGETVPYQPPVNGEQPEPTSYSFNTQKTTTAGQGTTDTKQVGFNVKSSAGSGWLEGFGVTVTVGGP